MSRSSSVSTKDRSIQGKRAKPAKQRRDDSESFDVRSQYTAFFPQQQAPTWVPTAQYPPIDVQQFNGVAPGTYQSQMAQQYGTPNQQFMPTMMPNQGVQSYNNMPPVLDIHFNFYYLMLTSI